MRGYLAGTMQRVGVGSRRAVHRQPVLRRAQNSAAEIPKAGAKVSAAGIAGPRDAYDPFANLRPTRTRAPLPCTAAVVTTPPPQPRLSSREGGDLLAFAA